MPAARPLTWDELNAVPDTVILDVRSPEEFAAGHVPNATNVPLDQLPRRLDEVGTGLVVCVCTHGGRRSQGAAASLAEVGVDAAWLVGGWEGYRSESAGRASCG
ncbi:MAG TPA: rhodanese-like domain-containing protein [Myxococcota bacterium]|nr:rhodanese-like domain-containing protein [Myxococcota bacterium]